MLLKLLIYFGAGFLFDCLSTLLYLAIEQRRRYLAGIISTALTILSCVVFVNLMNNMNVLSTIIAYAVGCGSGACLTVAVKERLESCKDE